MIDRLYTTARTRRRLAIGSHLLLVEGVELLRLAGQPDTTLVLKFVAIDSPSEEHNPVWLIGRVNDELVAGDYARSRAKQFFAAVDTDPLAGPDKAIGKFVRVEVTWRPTKGRRSVEIAADVLTVKWSPAEPTLDASQVGELVERRALVLAQGNHPIAGVLMICAGRLLRADARYVDLTDAGRSILWALHG